MQPRHAVHEKMHVAQVFFIEEAVFVLLQLLRHVDHLLIVRQQLADIAADLVDADQIALALRGQDHVLDPVQLRFITLHQRQILGDDLLEKIVQKALQIRLSPALCPADRLDHLSGLAAVVNEDDSLFIQRKGKAKVPLRQALAVGQAKCAGQGIIVDLRLGAVDVGHVRLELDAHVEPVPLRLPLLRRQHRNILALRLPVQLLGGALSHALLQKIIAHPVSFFPAALPNVRDYFIICPGSLQSRGAAFRKQSEFRKWLWTFPQRQV